ncbi:MAG: 3-oxoacyl-ACP reductase FabG [Deltaproteobacteria bacterium]|nr:3-oxoacyl-ACP reductase FabG [Deltaproteobacteria bacterium]
MRRVLVTGASRGIGRAIALRLARDGFAVTIHHRDNPERAAAVHQEILDGGGTARMLRFDVSDRETTGRELEGDVEAHGAYFGIVCNAGTHADAAFPAMSGEAWDRVLRTNLDGFFNVVRPLVMPMVRLREGGRIVTISSVSGVAGNRGQVNYSASKAGLIGATRSLALELARRSITVNSVAPGLIATEMIAGAPVEEITKLIPMRRIGTPEEVAGVVGFLFSSDASYVTGQVIGVSGGLG